jgi:hypothetical protein
MPGSLLVFDAKTPSFAMLTRYLYLSGRNSGATSVIPMRWQVSDRHHRLGPPSWNSNAYAIRGKCEKKIDPNQKSFQISNLQFADRGFAKPRGANCVMGVTVEQLRLRR